MPLSLPSDLVFSHFSEHVVPPYPVQENLDFLVPDRKFMLIIGQIIVAITGSMPLWHKGLVITGHAMIEKILVPNADKQIRQTQQAIQNQKVIKKHCEVYRACRDVVRAEKDAPDKALYRKQHQAEYQLHDVTLKELAELGIHKLPSSEKLQRQQLELEEELASAKKEKQDLQKQQKTLQVIEHNFDTMIREAGIKVPEKEPSQRTQEDVLS